MEVRHAAQHPGRELELGGPAAASQDDVVERHDALVDVDRQVGRQGQQRHAADHHAGQVLRLVRRGERDARDVHEAPHGVIDVEPRRRQHEAGAVLLRLLLRGDDDGVARVVERHAVLLAEGRRVGEVRVDAHELPGRAQPLEGGRDPGFDVGVVGHDGVGAGPGLRRERSRRGTCCTSGRRPGEARSSVRTLAQPRVSAPDAPGVNQAPSLIDTTPRAMRSVTRAGTIVSPRSLNTRTICPSAMPRAAASPGWIHTSCLSTRASAGWLSWIECVRARDLGEISSSGWRGSAAWGGIHVGIAGMRPRPCGSGLAAIEVE